jgi:hypothetical protein
MKKKFRKFSSGIRRALLPTPPVMRHAEVDRRTVGDLTVVQIVRETVVPVVIDDKSDGGYHGFGNDWWLQPDCPASFKYLSIDDLYPPPYFTGHGHPSDSIAVDIVEYMSDIFRRLTGRALESVLELGSGGGEITKIFNNRGLDFISVEGTAAGIGRLAEIGIPPERIVHQNLKFLKPLGRRFDLVMCTEVAEHIEPFFASKVVENCVTHADMIWFSAADQSAAAHYHHINEQPIEVWDNLFAHMGFPFLIELDGRHARASRIYLSSMPRINLAQ